MHSENEALPPGITAENGKLCWSYALDLWRRPNITVQRSENL